MANGEFPNSWRDPDFVAAIVGVVAVGALFFYGAYADGGPAAETIGLVLLWVLLPAIVAHELARRWLTSS